MRLGHPNSCHGYYVDIILNLLQQSLHETFSQISSIARIRNFILILQYICNIYCTSQLQLHLLNYADQFRLCTDIRPSGCHPDGTCHCFIRMVIQPSEYPLVIGSVSVSRDLAGFCEFLVFWYHHDYRPPFIWIQTLTCGESNVQDIA